jgi:hypothetical protein
MLQIKTLLGSYLRVKVLFDVCHDRRQDLLDEDLEILIVEES